MFKKLIFFIFFSFSLAYAEEKWNFPAISLSDANQDSIGAQISINNNDKAIAIWQRYDGSNYIIQTKYSKDGGNSWSLSATDLSAPGQDASSCQIVMNDSSAIAIWQRYDGSNYIIQAKYSLNDGISWSNNSIDLSSPNQSASFPAIAMNSSSKAIAIWREYDGTNYIIRSKYSTDGGQNWSASTTNLSDAGQDSFIPKVVINDSNQAIAMWAKYDGSNFLVQVKYSTDGGISWSPFAINLSTPGENIGDCQIALNNSNEAIAIWTRYNGSNFIVQTKYSTDGGMTWSSTATDLSLTGENSIQPKIVINDLNRAIAIWERFDGYNWIVQSKYSTDGGMTWNLTATDLSLPGRKSWNPTLALTNSNDAIAVWKRFSGENWIIQTKDSQDAGASWNPTTTNLSRAKQDSYQPEIAINSSKQAIVIWPRFNGSHWVIQAINNSTSPYFKE